MHCCINSSDVFCRLPLSLVTDRDWLWRIIARTHRADIMQTLRSHLSIIYYLLSNLDPTYCRIFYLWFMIDSIAHCCCAPHVTQISQDNEGQKQIIYLSLPYSDRDTLCYTHWLALSWTRCVLLYKKGRSSGITPKSAWNLDSNKVAFTGSSQIT
jgi:hypothetical protein